MQQQNKHMPFLVDTGVERMISLNDHEYSFDDARLIAHSMLELIENCNVAKINPLRSMFETLRDPKYQTIEIDAKTLADFQNLQQTRAGDIRDSVVALIEFYADMDKELNIVLTADAMIGRTSYTKYTAQLSQYIRHNQGHYATVKVEFDASSGCLGIFCRHTPVVTGKKFVATLTASLQQHQSFEFDQTDVPRSYVQNPALIRHLAKRQLGMKIKVQVNDSTVKISRI